MGKSIGIDFGTTNTLVSYINKKGKVTTYKTEDGSEVIPSAVFFESQDKWVIGEEAKQNILIDPQAGVENFKSLLGNKDFRYTIFSEDGDAFQISPREVTRIFLDEVLRMIEDFFYDEFEGDDRYIDSAVISVPAKFNYIEKNAIKKAATEANLDENKIRIVPESTAAAFAYINLLCSEKKPETILVYDFGGGTFDVSLLKVMNNGTYTEAVPPGGDKKLGGNKMTEAIVREIIDKIEEEYNFKIPLLESEDEYSEKKYGISKQDYLKNVREIVNKSNKIKELSSKFQNSAKRDYIINITTDKGSEMFEVSFTKKNVDELIEDDVDRTIKITLQLLEDAKNEIADNLEHVVIAGGSSNITMIKSKLEDALDMEITRADNVTTLISRGAALFAQKSLEEELKIISKTNTEIGIKVKKGYLLDAFETIIPYGMSLPTQPITKEFKLAQDNQTKISIEIFERDISNYPNAKRIRSEGISWVDKLVVDKLPENLKKDEITIEVTFRIEKDGTMKIDAIVKRIDGLVIENADMTVRVESDLR